jgi:hypothetical protein
MCIVWQFGSRRQQYLLNTQLDDDGWLQDDPGSDNQGDRRWRRRCCVLLPAVLVAAALAAAFELRLLHTKQVGPGMTVLCLQVLHQADAAGASGHTYCMSCVPARCLVHTSVRTGTTLRGSAATHCSWV